MRQRETELVQAAMDNAEERLEKILRAVPVMKDAQGTKRGKCQHCKCSKYVPPEEYYHSCAYCGHRPAEHESDLVLEKDRELVHTQEKLQTILRAVPVMKDIQGIKRGKCQHCQCSKYWPPVDYCYDNKFFRVYCGHHPAEHVQIEENPPVVAKSTTVSSASTFSAKVVAAAGQTIDGKKSVMMTLEKSPSEPLGIITTQLPGEAGFQIVGVQLKTPAYHAMKEGKIKFLDVITQLDESDIESKMWFEQITKSKTRPLLTIQRNQNTPSGIRSLFNKVERFPTTATHIRMAINPAHVSAVDFGIEPLKTTTATGRTTGYYLGVIDKRGYTAHMSGITIRDEVILYGTMNSKQITEGRAPLSEMTFKDDIKRAKKDGKHLVFALKNHNLA
jgi:hypothetical protein